METRLSNTELPLI